MKRTILLLFLSCLLTTGCTGQSSNVLPPKEFSAKLGTSKDAQLLDVRTPEEYAAGHIGNASNIDWNADGFDAKVQSLDKSKPVFVYCLAGGRSGKAAKKLSDLGFTEVYDLKGGYMKWNAEGMTGEAVSTTPVGICPQEYGDAIRSGKVLVNFYAEWCEPCKKMKPYMTKLEQSSGSVKILRLNADEHKTMVKELKLNELPALLLYEDGKLAWSHNGYISEEELKKHL